jgi:type II secretory pathway pseudopilin PulG
MKYNFCRVPKNKSQAGFSMLESVIAAMVSLIFISLGANLVLAANVQKIVAKRNTLMNDFVQSDLDGIRYQASILAADPTKCPLTLDPTLDLNRANGYAAALQNRIGADAPIAVKVMNRDYIMSRTTSISVDDSRLMTVSYTFTYGSGANAKVDYRLYTEVLPIVSRTCVPPT